MAINLTPRWQDFAVYLPALQHPYASLVASNKLPGDRAFPAGVKLRDLDFLNPKSTLWHYGYALYSAGQFADAKPRACAVTRRDRASTTILGDSGGFQIGKGTLRGMEDIRDAARAGATSKQIGAMWQQKRDLRRWIVDWLCTNSDYAMTIDMPLWAKLPSNAGTPFHTCSVDELIKLTVDNLKYIDANRWGDTKWLNVLQGMEPADSAKWWNAVKKYRMGGWALAGDDGWRGGLYNVLYYVMLIRDDGGFEQGNEWMHVLGVSQPTWAVILSAIQRAIRKECNNPAFRVSYDSASPFQTGGRYHRAVQYPKFGTNIGSWVMSTVPALENPYYAEYGEQYRFPFQSPVGDLMTMNHINVKGGFEKTTRDLVSDALLVNHNAWVYVRSFLEANELVFSYPTDAQHMVPKGILEMVDFIEDLLATNKSGWRKKLDARKDDIDKVFPKWGGKKWVNVAVEDIR